MFMKFTKSTSSPSPTIYPGFPYGGAVVTEPKWVDVVENVMFYGEIVLNIFIALLNITVCTVLWRATKPEYKVCFYIIMRTFTMFVTVNAIGTLVTMADRTNSDFETCWWLQGILIINMFTCIASSLWLFYAGFNRMMVLVYPGKIINAWGCWIVRSTLTIVALLALLLSIMYQKICGMYTQYDSTTNTVRVMTSSTMAEPLTIAIYAFPLTSLVFYVIAYNNLRQKRLLVSSDKTKSLIDRAERKTLKIGMIIMITYTIALVVHVYLVLFCTTEIYMSIYDRIDEIASTAPQIALPMALLSCNTRLFAMRRSSSSVSHSGTVGTGTGTVQDLYTKDTFMSEKKMVHSDAKMSTASNF